MACRAEKIGLNRSADFAAACPSQQRAVGGPTTKLAVAGGPRVRIHLPPAPSPAHDKPPLVGRQNPVLVTGPLCRVVWHGQKSSNGVAILARDRASNAASVLDRPRIGPFPSVMGDRRLESRLLRRRVSELRFCEVNGRGLASMTGPMNGLGWITERPRTSGRLRVPDGAGRLLTDIEFLLGRLGRIR